MNKKVVIGVFLAFILSITGMNAFAPDREFSANENRFLEQMPVFSMDGLISGRFMRSFNKYVTDQFVMRDSWVGFKTISELALGRRSSNGIYLSGDGLIDMFDTVDMEQFEKNVDIVAKFSQEIGYASVATMLVPSASMVLADRLPAFAPEIDQKALLALASEKIPGFIDVSDALIERKNEYIYYGTDHHWTSQGAFYAYNAWRVSRGLVPKKLEGYDREILSGSFYGTSYSKANLYTVKPDAITSFFPKNISNVRVEYDYSEVSDTIYELSFLDVKDKYPVFFNGNKAVTHVTTGIENGKRLLIVKDSYANTFAQFAIGDFEEVFMLDLRFYSGFANEASVLEFAEKNGVTDVLVLYSLKGFTSDTSVFLMTEQ